VSALCAACHELSQLGAPLIVVGAGLPHLPAVLSAAKSYSNGSSATSASTASTGSPPTWPCAPRRPRGRGVRAKALDLLYEKSGGYPYFVQAYGKATVGPRARPRR
jgi:hypothetical protein